MGCRIETQVLETLAERFGLEPERGEVERAVAQAAREVAGGDNRAADEPARVADQLVRAARDLDIRLEPVRLELAEALRRADRQMPILLQSSDGEWLELQGSTWGAQRLVLHNADGPHPQRWSARRIARALGLASPRAKITALAAQPLSPCHDLVATRNGSHGSHEPHSADHRRGYRGPLPRLVALLRPEWADIRVVVLFALAVSGLSLATPLAVEALVTTVLFNRLQQQLLVLSLILLICLALAAALRAVQSYVVEILQRRVFVRIVSDLASRLPRVHAEAWDSHYVPEFVNRFFDVLTVQKVVAAMLLDGVSLVISTLMGLIVLAMYHPFLVGFDLVVIAAVSFTIFILGRGAIHTSIEESLAKYDIASRLEEIALHPLVYKGAGGPEFALERVDAQARHYLCRRRDHFRIEYRQTLFALFFQALALSALLGLGGWLVIQHRLTPGQLVAAELIVGTVAGSFTKLGKHFEGYYDLMAAVDKLSHLLDLPAESTSGEAPRPMPRGADVTIADLTFTYPGSDYPALDSLSYRLTPGERIAIVGRSGSGKTTLTDLLFGLRAPTHGRIELDGQDYRDLRLADLREVVALVRSLNLIEGTLAENVRVGRHQYSLTDVREALEAVGLADEVSRLHDGLHTPIMSDESPLSHGQVRRVMLARAILGRPRLLIVEDLLDVLDPETRRQVVDSLFDPGAPWTLVLVTHDPDIIARCDRTLELFAPSHTTAHS